MKWKIDKEGSEHNGEVIELLNLDELRIMKLNSPDEILISIHGEEKYPIECNEDTRMGYVAYGFLEGYRFSEEI